MSELPDEVIAASKRLGEHPVVQPTKLPPVFAAIVSNYNRRHALLRKGETMTQEEWRELGRLRKDLRDNLIPSAEKALSWNHDKGQEP